MSYLLHNRLYSSFLDEVRKGVYRNLFNPSCLINGIEDGCSNFARGRFTIGKKYLVPIIDSMRKLVELCDNLQGFFIVHSMGGGTGSGLSTLLTESLNTEFSKLSQYQITIFPSPVLNVAVVEPYNTVMNIKECSELGNVTNIFDNEACFRVCSDLLGIVHPTFNNVNRVMANVFSDITVSLRFESSLNSDLSQLSTNLIPYPRIHFITSSHSPLSSKERFDHELLCVESLTRELFHSDNQLISGDVKNLFMSCCLQYRGEVNPQEVNMSLIKLKKNKRIKFVDWCPTGFKLGINCQPPSFITGSELVQSNKSATMLMNGCSIQLPMSNVQKRFDILFSKRSFIHWFVGEGMEEGEFNEARDEIFAIIGDYEEITSAEEIPPEEKDKGTEVREPEPENNFAETDVEIRSDATSDKENDNYGQNYNFD